MRKWQKAIAAAALLAALIALVWAWHSGPSYQGRSIGQWFYAAADFSSPPDRDRDREAFRAMGAQAVPFLIQKLEAAPSRELMRWLSFSQTASEIYRQRKEMWRDRAAYLLGEMGPAAKPAETNLIRATTSGNWYLQGAAQVALMKLRQEPPDPLIEKLKDTSDWTAWYQNALMVGAFGPGAEPAIPILLDSLKHTNNIIQAHALIALGMIARQPDQCVPVIAPFLSSPDVALRQKAMYALHEFGANALAARSLIQIALSDADPWVRARARNALKRIDGAPGFKPPGKTEP